jgi:hypothetical protein
MIHVPYRVMHTSWSGARYPISPEGRSKNASLGEAFFGWGEWWNELNVDGLARLPPPEKLSPLRFDEFFDLPSGEMSKSMHDPGIADRVR